MRRGLAEGYKQRSMSQLAKSGCLGSDAEPALTERGDRGDCLPGLLHRAVCRLHLLRTFWLPGFRGFLAGGSDWVRASCYLKFCMYSRGDDFCALSWSPLVSDEWGRFFQVRTLFV